MVENSDSQSSGSSTLEPYQKRRKTERQIGNLTAQEFEKAKARGSLLEVIRDLFSTGVTRDYVYDYLRVLGYRHRTRKALIEDALGSQIPIDSRTEEQKEEVRMLGKVKR